LVHLREPYPDAVREGIARALAVPEAKFGWDEVIRHYCDEQQGRAKEGLAAAIAAMAADDVIDDVFALVRNPTHGASRVLLLTVLERSADMRARRTLMELSTEPELEKEIRVILRRLKRTGR